MAGSETRARVAAGPAVKPWVLPMLILRYGGFSLRKLPVLFTYCLKVTFTFPLSLAEWIWYSGRIRRTELKQDPVFIIGHFRSGTTLMQKLMAADPQFGTFRNYQMLFPHFPMPFRRQSGRLLQHIVRILRFRNFHFNNTPFILADPAEEDMCMTCMFEPCTSFWGFVFPRRARELLERYVYFPDPRDRERWMARYLYYVKKTSMMEKGRTLLLKNPPNTARVSLLLALFPSAKFIYMYRDPRDVFNSWSRIWTQVVNRYYSLQRFDREQLPEIILEQYAKMIDQYESVKSLIPEGNLVEVRYETFEQDPAAAIAHIYNALNLAQTEEGFAAIHTRIAREHTYVKYSYPALKEQERKKVADRLAPYIKRWNYEH